MEEVISKGLFAYLEMLMASSANTPDHLPSASSGRERKREKLLWESSCLVGNQIFLSFNSFDEFQSRDVGQIRLEEQRRDS